MNMLDRSKFTIPLKLVVGHALKCFTVVYCGPNYAFDTRIHMCVFFLLSQLMLRLQSLIYKPLIDSKSRLQVCQLVANREKIKTDNDIVIEISST